MFVGGLLLFAAVVVWSISILMSPHGGAVAEGTDHVRTVVALFVHNSAIGTLLLSAISAWMMFPRRRPRNPLRDWAIGIALAVLVGTSLYQLIWTRALLS
jgi:hypothetical protein